MSNKFYISTPIYYPNDKLHLGHLYSTLIADFISKWKKINNFEVFFLTGSDEHGKKVEEAAVAKNLTPKEYVDKIVDSFKKLWQLYSIDYTYFVRTTDENHISVCKNIFSDFLKKDFLYKDYYENYYCVSCETAYTLSETDGVTCPYGHKNLVKEKEETYFLKISSYQSYLTNLMKQKDFLIPELRAKEMNKNFLEMGIKDLSITRKNLKWGIHTNEFPDQTLYVWIDALFNYISSLGYGQKDDKNFKKFWLDKNVEKIHIVGKEILRFHSLYWPAMLEMLKLPLPNQILAHGWITNNGEKMSKSLKNVIDPIEILNNFPVDAIRYYLLANSHFEKDFSFSNVDFINKYNSEVVNTFLNLISRTNAMVNKYFDGIIPEFKANQKSIDSKKYFDEISYALNKFQIAEGLKITNDLLKLANKKIDDDKPWDLFKNNKLMELKQSIAEIFNVIKIGIFIYQPIFVNLNLKIYKNLNISSITLDDVSDDSFFDNHKINQQEILGERLIEKI